MDSTRKGQIMEAPTNRRFSPARIVALVLITLAVLGLAYLRFAPGDGSVSVPAGARAGQLILEPCSYATENGRYDADCGTLVVPENRADAQSRLIALPVTRIQARSDHPAEPDLPARGRSGPHQHGLQEGEPVRRQARRRPRRLPRRRRLVGARLPGGRLGPEALRTTFSATSRHARTPTRSDPARSGSGQTVSTSPATRCRSGSTISRPSGGPSATTASTSSARAPVPARR